MGIYSRDYLRDEPAGYRPSVQPGSGSVCKWLIIANVVVFILQTITFRSGDTVTQWLRLDPVDTIQSFQIWRVLTYAFCHNPGSPFHILFNMLFVWWFGKTLEVMYGSREFLLFYLGAALVSGLCFLGLGLALGQLNPAIGASGAVMAIMMVYALYYPRQRIYLMGIIPLEIRWLVAFYVVYDSMPILNALIGGAGGSDGIAHSAHLGGLLFGFLYKKNNIRLETIWDGLRLPRFERLFGSRGKIRIYHPSDEPKSDENLDQQVDDLLSKIHEHGEASLTERERDILKRASQRYKKR